MDHNDDTLQTTKDVLKVAGFMLLAVLALMLAGAAAIGSIALAMSLGTVFAGITATLIGIFICMRLLSWWFRALVWHGFWLFTSAAASLYLVAHGRLAYALFGTFLGALASGLLGHLTTKTCSDKGLADLIEPYTDASGRQHKVINLDVSDLPGNWTTQYAGIIWGGILMALAIMIWGSVLNTFGSRHVLADCWAIFFGGVLGYSLVTMLIVGLFIEPRFKAMVFIQYLPADTTKNILRPGTPRSGATGTIQAIIADVSSLLSDLVSVSVRR